MNAKNVIIVLGNPVENGQLNKECKKRCYKAIDLLKDDPNYLDSDYAIILSGGVTKSNQPSEAKAMYDYLAKHLAKYNLAPLILQEDESLTTAQNILFTIGLLKKHRTVPKKVTIVGRSSQLPKTRDIVNKVWNYRSPTFEYVAGGVDNTSFLHQIADRTIMRVLSRLDPYDYWLLPFIRKLYNKNFRST